MNTAMKTHVVTTVSDLRRLVGQARQNGLSIGFVPTMGALHAGHRKLIETARSECGFVIVSIFVNPIQFDRPDDLARYPRTMDADTALCTGVGVDVIFAPTVNEMYPSEQMTFVDVPDLTRTLCGQFRPGHFRGVATVVLKLFNMAAPDRAYFGQKDAQQLAVIQRMVRDLNLPVEIVPVPTVRESDGLALSSRNTHLSPAERQVAPALFRALSSTAEMIQAGEQSASVIRENALQLLGRYPEFNVEYFELVDPATLQPVNEAAGRTLVAAAVWLGPTRLIDNVLVIKI